MKRLLIIVLLFSSAIIATADLPERNASNVKKYTDICRKFIYKDMKGMYREPGGALKFKFLAPGSSQYLDMLWDWDSWLSNVALRQILLENGSPKDRREALAYEQGCVLNALNYGGMDGWIPIWIERNAPSREEMLKLRNPWKCNMHKPTIAQHAAFIAQQNGDNAEWLREHFYYLQAFVDKYWNWHRHQPTGLIYWETDEAIGVDDDPSVFYRPEESSGAIFLNALMFKELKAMEYLAKQLQLFDIACRYAEKAETLKQSIRKHCWDERDAFYYSVDLNLRPALKPDCDGVNPGDLYLHVGHPRSYDCLIQRFSVWSGFMALWAGIATEDQANQIVEHQLKDPRLFKCAAGIRTMSPLEKMYDLRASGNPSSWAGPVWIVANYLVFRGLANYGFLDEAREIAEKTIILLGYDYERFGGLHEYYLPENGEPVLKKGFQNWNLLVLNMAAWIEGKETICEF